MILDDASEAVQILYDKRYLSQSPDRFGATTNRIFSPSESVAGGDGLMFQYDYSQPDAARWQSDPNGASADPLYFVAGQIKARWSQAGANDWSTISASCQVSLPDLLNGGTGMAFDLVNKVYNAVVPDYDEKLAIHRNLPSSGLLGTINGTVYANARTYLTTAGAASNSAGARFKVTGMSLAWIRTGSRLDFYDGATIKAGNIFVTDVNVIDQSIGVRFTTATAPSTGTSTGNLALLVTGLSIYFSGERNMGMQSLGAYFTVPATTGDSFLGGVDRYSENYRFLVPTMTNEGATSVKITRSQFDALALAMNYKGEKEIGAIWSSPPDINRTIRSELGENAFFQVPTGDAKLARFMHFGTQGLLYQDPVFGTVQIVADPLHTPNMVRFIVPETWETHYYGTRGLIPVLAQGTSGSHWMRMQAPTPNTGFSTFFKADWRSYVLDVCRKPWMNGGILNVTAS